MFNVQPVSSDAKRTFWPRAPIAKASWSSSTTTSMLCASSSTTILLTSAGAIALITNCAGSMLHKIMSTRSPANSPVTACTREPRIPTHVPTGSKRWSLVLTAIFERKPGSRAAALISNKPSSISGTSSSNKRFKNSGAVRDKINCGPRPARSIRVKYARTRSPTRKFSFGIIESRCKMHSKRPTSIIALPFSMRLIAPVTKFSPRAKKSCRICSRSASRTFCKITCLAACAPMRPKLMDSNGTSA